MKHVLIPCALLALSAPAFADQPVTINFAAEIGGKPFSCADTYDGLGATDASVTGTDYRMFVSSPALVRADGSLQPIALEQDGKWQLDDMALLDFEDGTLGCNGTGNPDMNTSLRGTVPEGDYQGLAFTIAVPFEKNHGDPTLAPAPLNATSMFWNWQNGFRFVRIDMVPTDKAADGPRGWFLHLGSTMCAAPSKTEAPSGCANPNRLPVLFTAFDPDTSVVVIDPAPVVAEADLRVNAPNTSPGCMSFPGDADCVTVMEKLGLPYDGLSAGAQQLVSVR
ncbi:MAG: MbnP family copper-binding protein [Qingshengfaniella sp.]